MKLTVCKAPNGAVELRSARGQVCEMLAGYDQTRQQDAQTIAHRVNVHDELVTVLEGAQAALRKALPRLDADSGAHFAGEWLDEIADTLKRAKQ